MQSVLCTNHVGISCECFLSPLMNKLMIQQEWGRGGKLKFVSSIDFESLP